MLLTVTTTHSPATDLGYLLAKNPSKAHERSLGFGRVHVFFTEATDERCTAALLLDVDPIKLSRGPRHGRNMGAPLEPYVNDRPYVSSSLMSVAIAKMLGSALQGKSKERQALADAPIELELNVFALPARGGEGFLRALFEPLGYEVTADRIPLDERFPSWGESRYFNLTLKQNIRLAEALSHLYVLIPVLDDRKHYWVGQDEIEKLLRFGDGWLAGHPQQEEIARRYLHRQQSLVNQALRRLLSEDDLNDKNDKTDDDSCVSSARHKIAEEETEKPLRLNDLRLQRVVEELRNEGATSVLDLGCGEGKLLRALLKEKSFTKIAGTDVAMSCLERAKDRLRLDKMPERKRARIELFQSSVTYRDERFAGFDALAFVEVIEHLDASRLESVQRVIFEFARPGIAVVTTPNQEYNVLFENFREGQFRHRDHRFEWTRAEFTTWAECICERFAYEVRFSSIGEEHPMHGSPTQMAVFSRIDDDDGEEEEEESVEV